MVVARNSKPVAKAFASTLQPIGCVNPLLVAHGGIIDHSQNISLGSQFFGNVAVIIVEGILVNQPVVGHVLR